MNRESINLVAEMLFRDAAATPMRPGSASTGLATLRQFMTEKVGAQADLIDVSDGSGLSEFDRVTARAMVAALHYAHESPWSAAFQSSLPVDGESGTLKNRSKGTPARGNLQAKTGTTNTVAALGGFVTARDGELLAFRFSTTAPTVGTPRLRWIRWGRRWPISPGRPRRGVSPPVILSECNE